MTANNKQVGGSHYKSKMECWDYILSNDLGYLEGTAIKYITRWKKKNGVEDIQKAIHFLEKLIEVEKNKPNNQSNRQIRIRPRLDQQESSIMLYMA